MRTIVLKSMIMVAALVCCMSCTKDDNGGGDARDPFVGAFRIHETIVVSGVTYTDDYVITIMKSSVVKSDIIIGNLANSGYSVNATVNATTFTIPPQVTNNGESVSGSGRLDGTNINFSLIVTEQGGVSFNVSGSGPKQ